ncbi:hypothetical protein FRC17_004558 [Serendipita sp. 399]|nr:hypothetical protein FRC17_004558 [Serendipita sp. 399]
MDSLDPYSFIEPVSRASSIFDLPTRNPARSNTDFITGEGLTSTYIQRGGVISAGTFIVLSGGSGCNAFCSAFPQNQTCYVLPVTDDGGSSSEIIRVIGGPSIGDVRSRLIRLIRSTTPQVDSIKRLLAFRLPPQSEQEAREMWREIIEGRSQLWKNIPPDRKELIRGFLVYFENEVLRRSHKAFAFSNGSIGNFFLAAAQLFFRSLPSSIFLFQSISNSEVRFCSGSSPILAHSTKGTILPVLVTNHTVTIAADLDSGKRIVGQCNISHPVSSTDADVLEGLEDDEHDKSSSPQNVYFTKATQTETSDLEGRIQRVYYINAHGNEIYPHPNAEFLSNLNQRQYLVYSCGSLWTSIIPCLALRGIASGIACSPSLKAKILLLNYKNDRETNGYTALDYVQAIATMLNRHDLTPRTAGTVTRPAYPVSAFVTHLVYLSDTPIQVQEEELAAMGVNCISVSRRGNKNGFNAEIVAQALDEIIASLDDTDSP